MCYRNFAMCNKPDAPTKDTTHIGVELNTLLSVEQIERGRRGQMLQARLGQAPDRASAAALLP